jgi:hypothetical protein
VGYGMHGGAALATAAAKVNVRNSIANNFFMKGLQERLKVNYYERMVDRLRSLSNVEIFTFSGIRTHEWSSAARIGEIIFVHIRRNSRGTMNGKG